MKTSTDSKTEVLVVDDEKEFLLLFSRMLDTWGYAPLTAAKIQKRNPRTGVIMLSGLADREIARQAIKLGAFDYVTKPPDFPALQDTLIACLSHSEYQSKSWWEKLMG